VLSLHRVVSPAELHPMPFYEEVLDPGRVADILVCFYRRRPWDETAGDALQRLDLAPRFEPRAHRVGRLFIVELSRLYREGELEPTQPSAPELSPRQKQILPELLAGSAPKQIARELGLRTHTVRDDIKDLYRRLGVCGREERMARFLPDPSCESGGSSNGETGEAAPDGERILSPGPEGRR
jgi:DNA-binding CsgD family transcriptional regulator